MDSGHNFANQWAGTSPRTWPHPLEGVDQPQDPQGLDLDLWTPQPVILKSGLSTKRLASPQDTMDHDPVHQQANTGSGTPDSTANQH